MRVLAAIKRVPITGGRIVLTDDSRAIDTRHLGFTMSPHEECGVEEAVRIIEANGGDSVVLTLGPPEAVEQLRDAMALGIDRAIHLQTDGSEWDGEATAAALTEAIRADEAASGRFDIIFFGNESADSGGFQVGARVAHALARPCVTGLKRIAPEGTSLRCETSPVPFAPLDVGMALAGRDTGSSQVFVTLSRTPHLDGEYARVGRAEGAWFSLAQGDIITDAKIVE